MHLLRRDFPESTLPDFGAGDFPELPVIGHFVCRHIALDVPKPRPKERAVTLFTISIFRKAITRLLGSGSR